MPVPLLKLDTPEAHWTKVALFYNELAALYNQKHPTSSPWINDNAYLGFKIIKASKHTKDCAEQASILLRDFTLQLDTTSPALIPHNEKVRDFLCSTFKAAEREIFQTRKELEFSGTSYPNNIMLGGNILLNFRNHDSTLVQALFQRDNHPKTPHPGCLTPPGGIVTERPSFTPLKELREELILFVDKGTHYEIPYFTPPTRYSYLTDKEIKQEMTALQASLPKARKFADIRFKDRFDSKKPMEIKSIQLEAFPDAQKIEGTQTITCSQGTVIDQSNGIVIQMPTGNKASICIPTCIPNAFINNAKDIFAVDGENIPSLENQGGREVRFLSKAELDEACHKKGGEIGCPIDILKAAHIHMSRHLDWN